MNGFPTFIPIFAGLGSTLSPQILQQAKADAASPFGSLLLTTCFEAFHTELLSLTDVERFHTCLHLSDFSRREDVLSPGEQYTNNPILSGTTLVLIQSLRYLAYIEESASSSRSNAFGDVLKGSQDVGILGFSSGIIPACVVAASGNSVTFLMFAVEAYRLAFHINVHTLEYRRKTSVTPDASLPWSMVFMGMDKTSAQEAILAFTKDVNDHSLEITAVMDSCVTISGRPDLLERFVTTVPPHIVPHRTTVNTLYHSAVHLEDVRNRIAYEVSRRGIRFPEFSDLRAPVREYVHGRPMDHTTLGSLVEAVIDLLVVHPVNWSILVAHVAHTVNEISPDIPVTLLSIGPGGNGLARSIERALPGRFWTVYLSSATTAPSEPFVPKQSPIAIVGMAVNLPGAKNTSELWELLAQGVNTISEIPEHRFKVSDYSPSQHGSARTMRAHTGNFIQSAEDFDHKFFKTSPREARSMDPQQRVLLHTAYEALENAGYSPNATPSFQQESFGVYVGAATHDYALNLRDEIDVYNSTGTLQSFLSGRISYAFGFAGPSVVVDTACSSSLVALYQGARALMNGDCTAALVGGVNIITAPDMFIGLDRGHFLSPSGQCRSFDASADGYSRSEGCGMFVLKRLEDAEVEGDNILGVIRGVEVNQSGQSHSITHPHAGTQGRLFEQLLQSSGVSPERVNVVEAHGTGTQAGDPNEMQSIRQVLCRDRPSDNPLHVGSVKANIGHLEAASGAAGLAKLLLMMRHRSIPRLISLETLNPRIEPLYLDNTVIDTVQCSWAPSPGTETCMAMLNNFGAAGSNVALLVEEYTKPQSIPLVALPHVFTLSAKTESAFEELKSRYVQWLQTPNETTFPDIAYTSTARREHYPLRLAVSAISKQDLLSKLGQAPCSSPVGGHVPTIAFVFSGQGVQYPAMGASIYKVSPSFRRHVDTSHAILQAAGFPGVTQLISPKPDDVPLTPLQEIQSYQAAVFVLEYSLAQLWLSWGIVPSVVVGHSLGEYAAMCIAGVIDLRTALILVATRARFMVERCALGSTGMLAVHLSPTTVTSTFFDAGLEGLDIACHNGPSDCVVSGPLAQLDQLRAHLQLTLDCKSTFLSSVPFGFHSSAMSPLLDDFADTAESITIRAPTIPIVSNVTGKVVMPGDTTAFEADYFARHCGGPVLFNKGIESLVKHPAFTRIHAWIEVGPHTSCLSMLQSTGLLNPDMAYLASLRKHQEPWSTLSASLAQLHLMGVEIEWRQVYSHIPSATSVGELPSYPWTTSKFWVPFREPSPSLPLQSAEPGFAFIHHWTQFPSPNSNVSIFETPVDHLAEAINGHVVGGSALCPASVYMELALAGVDLAKTHSGRASGQQHFSRLLHVKFLKPLVYNERMSRVIVTKITLGSDGTGNFIVSSRITTSDEQEVVHARGEITEDLISVAEKEFFTTLPAVLSQMAIVEQGEGPEIFTTRTAYDVIFPRVVLYAAEYRTIRRLTVSDDCSLGCAIVQLPEGFDSRKYVVQPVFMDTLLHVAGFIANMTAKLDDAYICNDIGTVVALPHAIDPSQEYIVQCALRTLKNGTIVAQVYAIQTAEPRLIVARIEDVSFTRVRLDLLSRSLIAAASVVPSTPLMHKVRHRSGSRVDYEKYVQVEVTKIIARACGIPQKHIDVQTDLSSLGVDSLMSIEIANQLDVAFPGVEFRTPCFAEFPTVLHITKHILLPSGDASGPSSPRTLVGNLPALTSYDPDSVLRVLAHTLGVSSIDLPDDVNFEEFGLDSLSSIEALQALKLEFGVTLPPDLFSTCTTVREVQAYFFALLHPRSQEAPKSPTFITTAPGMPLIVQGLGKQTPLFLIHDGSGLTHYYERLLPLNRQVWAINNPYLLEGSWPDEGSVRSMAEMYAENIMNTITEPLLIGGWSFGGAVAFEIASVLASRGVTVKGIVLIDTPCPGLDHVPLSAELVDEVLGLRPNSELTTLIKRQFAISSRMMNDYYPAVHCTDSAPSPPIILLRSAENYQPTNSAVDVPSWLGDRGGGSSAAESWSVLAGVTVKVVEIPGSHFEPFHVDNVAQVSQTLASACKYLETQSCP